jgi:hypothetical protein
VIQKLILIIVFLIIIVVTFTTKIPLHGQHDPGRQLSLLSEMEAAVIATISDYTCQMSESLMKNARFACR